MRYIFALIAWLCPLMGTAEEWEDQNAFGPAAAATTLRVLSSTDTSLFAPIIEDFLRSRPAVSVEYLVTGTAQIDQVFRAAPDTLMW